MIVQNGLHLNKGYGSFGIILTDCKALNRCCSYLLRGRPNSVRHLDLLEGIENPQGMGLYLGNGDIYWHNKKTLQTEEREFIWVSQGRHSNKCMLLFLHKITQLGKLFL